MGGIILFLVAGGAVAFWIMAGVRAYKYAESKGVGYFFMHLLSAIAVVFVLWLLIVYPTLDCSGFLCGLGEIIMWILISLAIMLVWPIILLPVLKRKFGHLVETVKSNEEIIDDI